MQQFHLTTTDNIPDDYSITQGSTYAFIMRYHDYDISDWNIRGQIRDNYADKNGNILASFDIPNIEYDPENGWTLIYVELSAQVTETLPLLPRIRQDKDDCIRIGSNVYVYDIEAENPVNSLVIKLAYGYVEIKPEVTRND